MDSGFKGLTAAQSNGDIPNNIITMDYSDKGLQTEYKHGTGCAEIVHDTAPDAELHLLKVHDEVDLYNALDYCIANGIDIISASIGFFGSGPGDGTGSIDEAFDEAIDNGILVVNAAGNHANSSLSGAPIGRHWMGTFHDTNSDNVHEFVEGVSGSWRNKIAAFPAQDDDGNPETNEVGIIMRWDDWPGASVDYNIYLFDFETMEMVSYSNSLQNGSQSPIEAIIVDLPDGENYFHYYWLTVQRTANETLGTEFELILVGTSRFVPFDPYSEPIATSPSSLMEPADVESVLAVGAINYAKWTTGPQEAFSSQGPTKAWAGSTARIKPDIMGPDGVTTLAYGTSSFFGTSASTPHVAGIAALILSVQPHLSPDELKAAIESSAIDMGPSGKDNIYGSGQIPLPPFVSSVVSSGWNLLSFYSEPLDPIVDSVLKGIKGDIDSAWKWENSNWSVYLPKLTQEEAVAYLDLKGLNQINSISSGEGFWVDSDNPQAWTFLGTQTTDTSHSLGVGWNLIGLKSNETKLIGDLIAGKEDKIASIWKWSDNNWEVYLPGEAGGGASYAGDKGFTIIDKINPGEGFWVNSTKAVILE